MPLSFVTSSSVALLGVICTLPLLGSIAIAIGRKQRFAALATMAIALSFALSLVALTASALAPAASNGLVRLDRLCAVMLVLVTGVSAIVHAFSMRYLDSDPAYARFFGWLSFVTSGVLFVVASNNLALLALAWVSVSLGLFGLQTHFADRPTALAAARAMRIAHLIGDGALVLGCVVLGAQTHEIRIDLAFAQALHEAPSFISIVVGLVAIAAFSKSSQIPFHRWLPDTMEAPTPVSALMHAGIVNAGGFLLARFSPLLGHAPVATSLIFLVGAATALWGVGCMLVRSDVKRGLAFSTQGQMGYMIAQCGLGAFPAAILHLFAHGVFKATLFLGSGYAVHAEKRELRASSLAHAGSERRWIGVTAAILVAPVGVVTALSSLGRSLPPYGWILLAFATLTCMQLVFAIVKRGTVVEIGAAALLVATALPGYTVLVRSFDRFLAPDVSATALLVAPPLAILIVGIFACGLVLGWGRIPVPRALRDRTYVWFLTERLPFGIAR